MIREHDRVVLTEDLPAEGLRAGDVGVVVHIAPDARSYAVEFMTLDGETIDVIPLTAAQVRAVREREIANARSMK
jgi:hypothetical protein